MPAAEFGDELVRIVEIFAVVLVPLQQLFAGGAVVN